MIASSGLTLMFVLGVRHGLDPDHIACIDGFAWRALRRGQTWAPWVGTLFAVGHGLLVTAMAVLISHLSIGALLPQAVWAALGWAPTVLLVIVGVLNLETLLRREAQCAPTGWKTALMPRRLRDSNSPWAVVLIGVLFATVFDTATQASAWTYVASTPGAGAWHALAAGLVFTAGMMLTDTIDSQIVSRVGASADASTHALRYRRGLGWLVVGMAFGVATYNIVKAIVPGMELDDSAFTLAGAALVMAVVFIGLLLCWTRRRGSAARGPRARTVVRQEYTG